MITKQTTWQKDVDVTLALVYEGSKLTLVDNADYTGSKQGSHRFATGLLGPNFRVSFRQASGPRFLCMFLAKSNVEVTNIVRLTTTARVNRPTEPQSCSLQSLAH